MTMLRLDRTGNYCGAMKVQSWQQDAGLTSSGNVPESNDSSSTNNEEEPRKLDCECEAGRRSLAGGQRVQGESVIIGGGCHEYEGLSVGDSGCEMGVSVGV